MTHALILGINNSKFGGVSFEEKRLTCNDSRFFKETENGHKLSKEKCWNLLRITLLRVIL